MGGPGGDGQHRARAEPGFAGAGPGAGRRRFLLVRNPSAGVEGRTLLGDVIARLTAAGARVEVVSAASAEDARAEVAHALSAEGADAVVAAGGDGTIRSLAQVLAGFGVPLGIIPLGTGNVMAREVGLMGDGRWVSDALLAGPTIRIHGGLVDGTPFFLMAGVGFDGRVVRALDARLKRRLGRGAYALPVLKALAAPIDRLAVEIDDGSRHEAAWVVAANARHYGGAFVIAPDARLDEPGLTAVLVSAAGRPQLLAALAALAIGRLPRCRGVTLVPCRRLTVIALRGCAPVEIDGDVAGETPVAIDATGPVLDLIVPRGYVPSGLSLERSVRATQSVSSARR